MNRSTRRAAAPTSRFGIEPLEGRVLLTAANANEVATPPPPAAVTVAANEVITARLDVNRLISTGQASVTATPSDIGQIKDVFDDDNATLYRTPAINPVVVELNFVSPKTVREFRLRFSHASSYRWKMEAAGGSLGGTYTEIVPWTSATDTADSVRRLAAPVSVTKLRLTGQRLVGDNYVHLDEWRIFADLNIVGLTVLPSLTTIRQFETRQFIATGTDDTGASQDLTRLVAWSTSDDNVASADKTGLVTGTGVGQAEVIGTLGSLSARAPITVNPPGPRDLDATYIERTPRYNYDAAKNNPAPGDVVTFHGHVRNWDNVTPSAAYRWEIDGATVASGTLTDLAANEERIVTLPWAWQNGPHRVRLTVDPDNAVAEASEANNFVEDRTDGLAVGFWVEQSLYDYFHRRQHELGIGSNSWEDWAQRQMAKWNEHNVNSIWDVTPDGVTDRVRVDKITVVPDGALPLAGGLPSNNPDTRDKTVDLMWGFEWDPSSTFYSNTTSRDPGNPFYLEPSLIHELGHARYQVDEYTWDVANNASVTQVQIIEPTTGQPVAGTPLMPWLAFDSVLYYNQSGGIMTGPYGNNVWSPHEAGALQRIAGRRAVAGNQNAPGNIGEFLNDLPQRNHVRFVDGSGQPLVGADVRWYAASPGPGYGGKTFDNTPEYTLTTDANGEVLLPRDPFLPGQHKEAVIRVARGADIWYRFFEVSEMNLEYWRGHTQDAHYTVELPLRTSPPEMDVQGKNVTIADGDTTPSTEDLTDFGDVNVNPTGPNDGYVIRTFVVKNRGGQPLRLTGGTRIALSGVNASDFSVIYQPADTLTSETLTVFQIKFDPRAPGVRTANVSIADNDSNENPYNFTIRGNGVIPGAQVSGSKFNDLDFDGTWDAGEPGLPNWTIFGDLDDDGVLDPAEPSAVTAADGSYTLYGLPTDRITHVREVHQVGWKLTTPAEGYHVFNPFIDAVQQPLDFGNTKLVHVTGTVFDDRDGDGVQDPGEVGLAGRTVYGDLDEEGTLDPGEPTAVTDTQGRYDLYVGPEGGDYVIRQVLPAGWRATLPGAATRVITVMPAQEVGGVDFGDARVVAGRYVFYNNSAYDGNSADANAADDAAIAADKAALLPGGPAGFGNFTSYSRGLNGIMVDVADVPGELAPEDFSFTVGNGGDPATWQPAPAATSVTVRRGAGAGGTDRVTVVWPDGAVRNTWLRAVLNANPFTGLTAPDVFYFGNLIGETGDATPYRVNAIDLSGTRANQLAPNVNLNTRYDFNRDRRVNALDLGVVRSNQLASLNPPTSTLGAAALKRVREKRPTDVLG